MEAASFLNATGAEFFTGVPDSQLKALCNYLIKQYGIGKRHVIAANEGNACALAAGYHLATGKVPMVYMQNSGLGNIMNPAASLLHPAVYGIPCLFVVGWRGEPGLKDEPQHVYQGQITLQLLEDMEIATYIVDKNTTEAQIEEVMEHFRRLFQEGKSAAFVIRKDGLQDSGTITYQNDSTMNREEVIRHILCASEHDIIISTTGKISRELFELREAYQQEHGSDFLTVGSMGHASSIALGISLYQEKKRIWCVDGDGAALMHLGAIPMIASIHPHNFVHIILNNGAHETVGGMPTTAERISFRDVALACGYEEAVTVKEYDELDRALDWAKGLGKLVMVEAKCALGARSDLGRPTTTAEENKVKFMDYLHRYEEKI